MIPQHVLDIARRLEGKGAATAEQAAVATFHAALRDKTADIRAGLVAKLNAIAGATPGARAAALGEFDAEIARLAREPVAAFSAELRVREAELDAKRAELARANAELARANAELAAAESMHMRHLGIPAHLWRSP